MARISIKDLPRNTELDRQAMQAIVGGSRGGRGPLVAAGAGDERSRHWKATVKLAWVSVVAPTRS